MSSRNDVPPSTLSVDLVEGGVVVEYLDGREVFYNGVPEPVEGAVETPPGKEVHVLVTDSDGVEGVMTYVNDRNTHDDILETTGVGRVMLDRDDEEVLYPGVTVTTEGYSILVEADLEVVDGRVFVFAEDEMSEHAYELVPETDSESTAEGNGTVDDDETSGNDADGTGDGSEDAERTRDDTEDEGVEG